MALSLRKSPDRGTVGLDIDGRYLAAAQVHGGRVCARQPEPPRGRGARRRGRRPRRSPSTSRASPPPTASAQRAARRRQPADRRRVIELPRIEDAKQRDAAVRFQAAEAIAMPLDEAVLDHQVAGSPRPPTARPRMQVVVVAARRRWSRPCSRRSRRPGSRPTASTSTPSRSSARSRWTTDGAEARRRVFCHLGGVTNLAIAVGTSCFFTRPLRPSGTRTTPARALADEIRLSIDYYMAQPQAQPVGEVVLSGPGLPRRGLVEGLGRHLGLPVQVAAPLGPDRRARPRSRRGSAPLHGRGRPLPGSGGMRPVNLFRRTSAAVRPSEARPAAPTSSSACSACCSSWSSATCGRQPGDRAKNEAAAASAEADQLEAAGRPAGRLHATSPRSRRPARSRWRASPTRASTGSASCASSSRVMPEGSWLQAADASVLGDPTAPAATSLRGRGAATPRPPPTWSAARPTRTTWPR